ncbi:MULTISPECIES: fimbrial protein [Kosakonia]|uniref:Fimbrial protein n=1 Tax=Kosakonia sacchari TaxID=1158459 RepID=A0ABZ0MPK5_9ENTR|nr:fimbrial protein [Kosakonia sacchari]WOZ77408.1 fimbrial protein [Kosakonia sacchari]
MPFIRIILLNIVLLTSLSANALCKKGPDFQRSEEDSYGLSLAMGTINVSSLEIQPVGSPLGSNIVNFSQNPRYTSPDNVLWVCDIADKDNIFEIIATNGDDRNGGFFDLGSIDGYPNYYGTLFEHVALRLTHLNSGTVFTRQYQRIPMKNYQVSPDGTQIYIRVKDFSPIRADLIRVSSTSPRGQSPDDWCGRPTQLTSGSYSCNQPNGYVSFCSPGSPDAYCDSGDSAFIYTGWYYDNWMAINMGISTGYPANLVSIPTCVAKSVTPMVFFPTISVSDLNNGQTAQSNFNVHILCEGQSTSGETQGMTAMGLQVPYESYLTAQQLNLVNASGGVSHLLSEKYGQPGYASGVGIQIANSNDGVLRNFIGWSRCLAATCQPGGNGGWYAVRDGATQVTNNGSTAINEYVVNFNAYLTRIAGETVTAGKVDASAEVLVKVQ